MSGIEVVGIVLGAIPLAISALEHYEDTIGPVKAFINWQGELKTNIRELYKVMVSYDQSIRLLLRDVAEPQEREIMMEDSSNQLWTQGEIANTLRLNLDFSYDAYMACIEDIAGCVAEIVGCMNVGLIVKGTPEELRLVVVNNTPIAKTSKYLHNFRFAERINFTMKKRRMAKIITAIRGHIDQLNQYQKQAKEIAQTEPNSTFKLSFSGRLSSIHDNASKVHEALMSLWCGVKGCHNTGILLEQRLERSRRWKTKLKRRPSLVEIADCSCFCISFHDDCADPKEWLGSEFRIPDHSSSNTKVRIVLPNTYGNAAKLTDDICTYINDPNHRPLGFCLDTDDNVCVYQATQGVSSHVDLIQTMSLERYIPKFKEKLPYEDIYWLTITLIASLFQLSHTPWLNRSWTKKDIHFLRWKDPQHGTVDIKRPYLTVRFDNYKSSVSSLPAQQPASHNTYPNNQPTTTPTPEKQNSINLLGLATMLLEITAGQSIEEVRIPQDLGMNGIISDASDFQTVKRWREELIAQGLITAGFSTAVLTCMNGWTAGYADFQDPNFTKAMERDLLQPIEMEMVALITGGFA